MGEFTMHLSSLANMQDFRKRFLDKMDGRPLFILDIGSQAIGGCYREIFTGENWKYIGVDVAPGDNVDLVLSDPYNWTEIKSESVDVLVSGQAFEHIAYVWVVMKEVARVLKPGGICCIIAPSGGPIHRYPVDCWRFLPDGMEALARYADLEVVEAGNPELAEEFADDSAVWADSVLVAKKSMDTTTSQPENEQAGVSTGRPTSGDEEHIYKKVTPVEEDTDSPLRIMAEKIQPGSTVLELGPATGYFSKYLREELDCDLDGVELSEEMAATARPWFRDLWVADLDSVDLLERFQPESYDYVVVADVFEHLREPDRVLRSCWTLLKKNGRLLVSVPNIGHAAVVADLLRGHFHYSTEGLLDRTHVRFFTRESLLGFLHKGGFGIENIETLDRLPEETEFYDDLHDFSKDGQELLLKRPDALTFQFVVSASPSPVCRNVAADVGEKLSVDEFRENLKKQQREELDALTEALREAEKLALEREKDKNKLHAGLAYAEKLFKELQGEQAELHTALQYAEGLAVEREAANVKLREELESVYVGLKQAEKLAFERFDELEQIKSTRTWRLMRKLRLTGQ